MLAFIGCKDDESKKPDPSFEFHSRLTAAKSREEYDRILAEAIAGTPNEAEWLRRAASDYVLSYDDYRAAIATWRRLIESGHATREDRLNAAEAMMTREGEVIADPKVMATIDRLIREALAEKDECRGRNLLVGAHRGQLDEREVLYAALEACRAYSWRGLWFSRLAKLEADDPEKVREHTCSAVGNGEDRADECLALSGALPEERLAADWRIHVARAMAASDDARRAGELEIAASLEPGAVYVHLELARLSERTGRADEVCKALSRAADPDALGLQGEYEVADLAKRNGCRGRGTPGPS